MSNVDHAGGRWRPFGFTGMKPLVAFLVLFSGIVLASNVLWDTLFEVEASLTSLEGTQFGRYAAWSAVSSSVQLGLAALVLKYEGVNLRDVGLNRTLLMPALAAGGAVVVAVNVAVAALGVSAGNSLGIGFFPQYESLFPSASSGLLAALGVQAYLFVGPAEELAFRGYLQNKLVSLFGEPTRGTRAAAVGLAALCFGLVHLPVVLIGTSPSLGGVVGAILLSGVSGVVFGTIYELTRNLYVVMLLHGFGDWWPIFVDAGSVAWPNWGVIIVVYALLVAGYRWWAKRTPATSLDATPAD